MAEEPTPTCATAAGKVVRWVRSLELGYLGGDADVSSWELPLCFRCGEPTTLSRPPPAGGGGGVGAAAAAAAAGAGTTAPRISRCARCRVAPYCSRECQVSDWKSGPGGGHRHHCAAYKRVGANLTLESDNDKRTAREDILRRVRLYALPYAVHRSATLGRGFLFVQSGCSLAELSLPTPKRPDGRPLTRRRSVLLHFLTLGEYDQELCRDDFEMATVRLELKETIDSYDERGEVPVLVRFRCGHMAVGVAPLVPDYGVCRTLGRDYYQAAAGAENSVQLDLDDL